jgi:hypothetical protein
MKTIVWLSLMMVWLTGCVGLPMGSSDINLADVQAQGTISAVRALQTSTAQAVEDRAQLATLAAAQTQDAQAVSATQQAAQVQATAQAMAFEQTQAAVTQQAQASATAAVLTATPLAATQAAFMRQVADDERRAAWQPIITPVMTLLPVILLLVALGIGIYGGISIYRRLMPIAERRMSVIQRRGPDAPFILFDGRLIDPSRLFGPVLELGTVATSAGHAPTLEHQAQTTARAQAAEVMRAMPASDPATRQAAQKWTVNMAQPTIPTMPQVGSDATPADAPWRMLNGWQGGSLPLGMSSQGLILANPESQPHFLIAGTSGSGKTRYGLRPLIASALADGWQTAIFDRSGLDFLPFRDQPNANLTLLDNPADAVGYLEAIYAEIQRRFVTLRDAGVSTWGRLPGAGPRLLAVFDEFSNLADSLSNQDREALWRNARMVAAEGRKAGVHMALALQDPTYKSIDLRIRRNCTPVSYRVKDQDASRVIIGADGAEMLGERQFLAAIGTNLVRGVGFAPQDEEIRGFLEHHRIAAIPAPGWLQPASIPAPESHHETERIRELKSQGLSLNEIQRQVFGFCGGAAYAAVREALGSTTTTEAAVLV